MCSFVVYTKEDIKKSDFELSLESIKYRGPDKTSTLYKNGMWGFNRLAIMGLDDSGMQPFISDDNIVVCNGELYGFRKEKDYLISKGYTFKSNSDCEILLPMYKEYGINMFNKLDAEFACVIYDSDTNSYIAARDSIGIRPMFYGFSKSNGIMFASEAKVLIKLCEKVLPFPPGYYYMNGEFNKYYDATKYSEYHNEDIDSICKGIKERLVDGVVKRLDADAPLGFLLSGGLDSSLVCAIAQKKLNKPIRTFAIGMSRDAIDLKYAKEVADYIGSDHTEVYMDEKQAVDILHEVIYHLETWDITTIRASIGMYLLTKWIHEHTDIKVLMTGEVSDELFGYKYTDFAPNESEFQKESEKRIRELYMYDVLRADRCISGCSIEGRVPFADLKFVDYVMGINPELKMNKYKMGKYLLRHAFEGDYLPHNILYREKAAFSDAVGHSMVDYLKEYADKKYTNQEFYEGCKKYKIYPPFTKESLLYRDIFESYYPGRADLIADYWMPNKTWEGFNVTDPSARVLSNYGDSGK